MMRSLALLVALFGIALAHSWLGCADYHIRQESDAQVFNPANCKAWGRNWKNLGNPGGTFGLDNGYDFLTNAPVCRDNAPQPLSNGYSATWPMAQYTPGQNVCLAWPAKNHVAATCNNPYIPDNGLNIWVSKANPTSNPTVGDLTLVKAFPKNTAANQYAGFQNCPQFCSNQDKATCTGCFTVPSNLQPGSTYTFVWAWAFNGENQIYSNCWEAQIGSTDPNFTFPPTSAAPTTQQTSQPTTTTTTRQTSQQQTSQQQTSQQQTSQPTTQQTSQPTQTQSPSTSAANDCISQCVQICGTRGVDSCNCAGGFNVVCGKNGDESTSPASMIVMSAFAVASAILF